MLVSMIAGPWVGLVTGLLGNVVNGMLNPVSFGFAFVSMVLGLVCGFMSKWKWFTNVFGIVIGCAMINVMTGHGVRRCVNVFIRRCDRSRGAILSRRRFLQQGRRFGQQ